MTLHEVLHQFNWTGDSIMVRRQNCCTRYFTLVIVKAEINTLSFFFAFLVCFQAAAPQGTMTYGTNTYQERSVIFFSLSLSLRPPPPGASHLALGPSKLAQRHFQLALRPSQLVLRLSQLALRLTLLDPRPYQGCSFLRGSHSLFGDPPNGI